MTENRRPWFVYRHLQVDSIEEAFDNVNKFVYSLRPTMVRGQTAKKVRNGVTLTIRVDNINHLSTLYVFDCEVQEEKNDKIADGLSDS